MVDDEPLPNKVNVSTCSTVVEPPATGEKSIKPFEDCEIRIESYGPGGSEDCLLRVLPNGFPVYEISAEKRNEIKADEDGDDWEWYSEYRLSNLQRKAEKFFLMKNEECIKEEREQDPIAKNEEVWVNMSTAKAEAIAELVQLQSLFELMSKQPEVPGKQRKKDISTQVALHDSIRERSPKLQVEDLVLAFMSRYITVEYIQGIIRNLSEEVDNAVNDQGEFLEIIAQLRPWWKLQKIPYASHVFTESDATYPYRAELIIEVCSLPSSFLSLPPNSPIYCWPPIPPTPPFATVYAELYLVRGASDTGLKNAVDAKLPNKALEDELEVSRLGGNKKGGIESQVNDVFIKVKPELAPRSTDLRTFLKFSGDVAYYTQSRCHLRVKMHLLEVKMSNTFRNFSVVERLKSLNNDVSRQLHLPTSVDGTTLPPLLAEMERCISNATANEIDKQLQISCWVVVDRAVHAVITHQASLMKHEEDNKKDSMRVFIARIPPAVCIPPVPENAAGAQNGMELSQWGSRSDKSKEINADENCKIQGGINRCEDTSIRGGADDGMGSSDEECALVISKRSTVVNWSNGQVNLVLKNVPLLIWDMERFEDKERMSAEKVSLDKDVNMVGGIAAVSSGVPNLTNEKVHQDLVASCRGIGEKKSNDFGTRKDTSDEAKGDDINNARFGVVCEVDLALSILYVPKHDVSNCELNDKSGNGENRSNETSECRGEKKKVVNSSHDLINTAHTPDEMTDNHMDTASDEMTDECYMEGVLADLLRPYLQILEGIAVNKLRQNFVASWKFASYVLPVVCADVHPKCTISRETHKSGDCLSDFIDWIYESLTCGFFQTLKSGRL